MANAGTIFSLALSGREPRCGEKFAPELACSPHPNPLPDGARGQSENFLGLCHQSEGTEAPF